MARGYVTHSNTKSPGLTQHMVLMVHGPACDSEALLCDSELLTVWMMAAERRASLRQSILLFVEKLQDLVLADVAVADQQELEQILVCAVGARSRARAARAACSLQTHARNRPRRRRRHKTRYAPLGSAAI